MFLHELALSLAYLGAALGVVMVVPQVLRILRHPTLSGVSPASWGLTALACLCWLTYGVRTGTLPQVPGNVLLVTGAVAIVLLVPSEVSRARRAAVLAGSAAAVVTIAFVVAPTSVGYVAFSVGLVSAWPQVYDSLAGWRAGGASAVSVTTWSIKAVSQTCWLTYALLVGDVPVTISATAALGAAMALVAVEASRRLGTARRLDPVSDLA